MNKISGKFLVLVALGASVALFGGCKSKKPTADLSGSASSGNLYGDPLVDDVPIAGSNLDQPATGDRSLFGPVYFAYDNSQVNPEEAGKVEEVAKYLKKNGSKGVILEGHADERGSREYNLALGERRALAVRDYLVSLGIDPSRIQTKSYGEEMPANAGHDESAWRQNRRVVFAVY